MRKTYSTILILVTLVAGVMLVSCDPMSSVEYKIYNKTADTVTVTLHKEILTSPYNGFTVEVNDSVTNHYGSEDSTVVAVLAPDRTMTVNNEWSGLYREERIVPLWRYIKSIMVGENNLPAATWNNEAAWHLKVEGGGRFEGESRYYSIILR